MRWNKCAVCAGLLCLLLAAAGCAYKPLFWDINLLMRPPLLQGELGELQSAVLEDNRGYRFAQAVGGKFRDAITLRDLDGDGSEEALMFLLSPYAIDYPEEQMSKTFCVYSKASGKWRQLPTEAFSINGYLDSFDFIDMDGDGTEEIIVSSRLFLAEGAKSFTLLFPEADETGGVISRIRTQDKMDASGQIKLGINYTQLIFADLDGDGVDEACYTRLGMADAANNSVAGAFRYDAESKTLEALGEIPLDPNVSQHEQPKYLPLAGGRGAILFDAFKGETGVITELIYYDAQTRRLAAPFLDQETGVNMATFRAQRVLSRDFDGDGRVDVPSQYDMPGSSVYSVGSSAPTGFPLIQWSRVQADFSLQPYTKHLLYLGPNQWVQLPERLRDVVENPEGLGDELTVRGNPEDAQNTLHFYSWDQKTGHTVGKELFWLRIVGAGQRNALAEYEIMGEGRQRRLRLDFLETVRTSA